MCRSSSKRPIRWWRGQLANLILLILVTALFWCCGAQRQGPPQEALVSKVRDGDTVVLKQGIKVRLVGIDAPEFEREGRPAEFLAHKASRVLTELVKDRRVRLEYDRLRYDRYGRLLAYLFLPDGTMVNAELLRRGLANVYLTPPNTRYQETLLAAQRQAIEASRGIWQQALTQDEPYYLANRSSFRVHRPGCRLGQRMSPSNRRKINSLRKAYLQGYSPCRTCKP